MLYAYAFQCSHNIQLAAACTDSSKSIAGYSKISQEALQVLHEKAVKNNETSLIDRWYRQMSRNRMLKFRTGPVLIC